MTDYGFRRLVLGLLFFNTFLICGLAGAGFVYVRQDPPAASPRLPLAGEDLPAAERKALQAALAEEGKAMRPTSLEGRQARTEAAALLGQAQLDPAALAAALERARTAEVAVRAALERKALEFAAGLTLEQRRRLAQGLIAREAPRPVAAK
ncbi:periplasmic heavy metal sensor [Allorhizobium undicola]|uniref:periplasmic heavy metal sensor n=1 Tax=Allorhizobium undicola TaxID=78527 RepID=UPI003D33B23D